MHLLPVLKWRLSPPARRRPSHHTSARSPVAPHKHMDRATHTQIQTHTLYTFPHMNTYISIQMHTKTHMYTHTCTHTHTHTHTHAHRSSVAGLGCIPHLQPGQALGTACAVCDFRSQAVTHTYTHTPHTHTRQSWVLSVCRLWVNCKDNSSRADNSSVARANMCATH